MRRFLPALLFPVAVSLVFAELPAGKFFFQGPRKSGMVALTFDDGPGPNTLKILEILDRSGVKATFFMDASQAAAYPAIAAEVVKRGHQIGNHHYQHLDFHRVKPDPRLTYREETLRAERAIVKATGVRPAIIRSPHGFYAKKWLPDLMREMNYAIVHWSFGCDWRLKMTSEQMADQYKRNVYGGAVLLFHDGGRKRDKTLAVLPGVIDEIKRKGLRAVTVDEMFAGSRGSDGSPSGTRSSAAPGY